ncbi:hypothetical protein VTL71DRAFT_4953 [Oculimacula yallundae]|uniref:Uncharacterized protein n=1 Tax=Oculimacula yallundae TaxID=86028 RepID=A0ABR4C570_9HELO
MTIWAIDLRAQSTPWSSELFEHFNGVDDIFRSTSLFAIIRQGRFSGYFPMWLISTLTLRIPVSEDKIEHSAEFSWLSVSMSQLARCLEERYPAIWESLDLSAADIHARLNAGVGDHEGFIKAFHNLISGGGGGGLTRESLEATFGQDMLPVGEILVSNGHSRWVALIQLPIQPSRSIPVATLVSKSLFTRDADGADLATVTYRLQGPESFIDCSWTDASGDPVMAGWWQGRVLEFVPFDAELQAIFEIVIGGGSLFDEESVREAQG